MANPTLLTMPLCVNADKNTIPSTDAGISGAFSEEYGWQNINSLPLASGGKAPNRRDFNGVLALLGGIAYACQRGFTFEWDENQDYVTGCVVIDTNDGKRYECISDVTANSTPPNADTTHWKEFGADTTVLANTDLSNLTATGEARFTGRADTSLSNLTQAGQDSFLERDFTIIYPNNGTEANPATITTSSKYLESNPFPGYYVDCTVECLYNDEWYPAPFESLFYGGNNQGYGTSAAQIEDNQIKIVTGNYCVCLSDENRYGGFAPVELSSAPARVKVWKIGKIQHKE